MKRIAVILLSLLLIISLSACGRQSADELYAPLPDEISGEDHIRQTVESAPSNAVAIIYGDEFMDMDSLADAARFDIPSSAEARRLLVVSVADNTAMRVTGETEADLWAGTLDRGESIILSTDIPSQGGNRLWISIGGGDSYYTDLNENTLDLSGWIYVVE